MKSVAVLFAVLASLARVATGQDEASRSYRELFRDFRDVLRLRASKDDSIAVQATWEALSRTNSKKDKDGSYRPDSKSLEDFLSFLELRGEITLPEWWRKLVLDASSGRRGKLYAVEDFINQPDAAPSRRMDLGMCPKDATLERAGDSIAYVVGDDRITIPKVVLTRAWDEGAFGGLSGCFTDTHFFLAIYGGFGHPHPVVCINRQSGEVVWQSRAYGCYWGGVAGMGESWVIVVPAGKETDRVFVFGVAATGIYCQNFLASDGKTLFHFSSSY